MYKVFKLQTTTCISCVIYLRLIEFRTKEDTTVGAQQAEPNVPVAHRMPTDVD